MCEWTQGKLKIYTKLKALFFVFVFEKLNIYIIKAEICLKKFEENEKNVKFECIQIGDCLFTLLTEHKQQNTTKKQIKLIKKKKKKITWHN